MKNILFILIFFLSGLNAAKAQLSFGIGAGIQSAYFLDKYFYLDMQDKGKELLLKADKGKYGLHFGGFSRLKIRRVFLQAQLDFNSDNISYTLKDLNELEPKTILFHERFYTLTLPLKFGISRSIITFYTGPVANYQLLSISDLWQLPSFRKNSDKLSWSWTVGMGLDLHIVRADISLEQGLGAYGDHIQIDGKSYNFNKNPGRFILSLYLAL